VRGQRLVLTIPQFAHYLVLAQALLLLLLVALQADVTAARRAPLLIDKEVGVLLDQGRVVLLLLAQSRLHGGIQLGALRVQNLALTVRVLHRARPDLDAALMDGVRLQLQAILLLLRGVYYLGLVARVLRSNLSPCADLLLIIDQDRVDTAFATALILRKAANLVWYLALASLAVVGRSHLHAGSRTLMDALLGHLAVLQRAILRRRQHHALAVLGCGGRRLIEVEYTL